MDADLDESWALRPVYVLLGDQSLDTHGFLCAFTHQTELGELSRAFSRQASHALERVIERLPAAERGQLPVFRSLGQLNERYHESKIKHAGIDAALLAIAQLAHFLE
jgi:hypothetical protein